MKREVSSYYPVFMKLTGKRCVVIGGGQVALRKVGALIECGADIEVISPHLCPELNKIAEDGGITVRRRPYRSGDLKGASIAVAATGEHGINLEIVKEARSTGALINVVDDPENSDFIVPSYFRRGDVTVAVSTAGRSPALARKIRTGLETNLGEEYAALALIIDGVRDEMKKTGIMVNGDDWQRAIDLDMYIELLKKNDAEKVRQLILDNLKALCK